MISFIWRYQVSTIINYARNGAVKVAIFNPILEEIAKFKTKPTNGEQAMLNFLAENLDDSYDVFFQPNINGDCPDFVIMRKGSGVLIIEVKDWELNLYNYLSNEKWELKNVMNQYTGTRQIVKSPIAQVETYKNNFYKCHIDGLIDKKIKDKRYYGMIHCAVYLHNASDCQISNFFAHSKENHCAIIGRDSLTDAMFEQILTKAYMKSRSSLFTDELYEEFSRLLQPLYGVLEQGREIIYTSDQKKIIQSIAQRSQKARGVAGSGKTQALVQRAVNAYERTGEEVLILTFNISLRNYIHDKLSNIRKAIPWKCFTILHYHAFFIAYCNNCNLHIEESFDKNDEQLFPQTPKKYKTIIIDEIQDYKKNWVKNIYSLLADDGELLFLGDEKQNIYKRDMEKIENKPYTGMSGTWTTLKTSFRLSNDIAKLADEFQKEFLAQRYEYEKVVYQAELNLEQSDLVYYFMPKFDAEKVVNIYSSTLYKYNIHDNEVCILSAIVEPLRAIDLIIRQKLRRNTQTTFETQELYDDIIKKNTNREGKLNRALAKRDIDDVRRSRKINFWMNSGKTKLSTIHSFKGWEIHTLLLVIESDIQENSQNDTNEFTTEELIYTAITRCIQNIIIINAGNPLYHSFFKKHIGEQRII